MHHAYNGIYVCIYFTYVFLQVSSIIHIMSLFSNYASISIY